jgi:hypothetical protein
MGISLLQSQYKISKLFESCLQFLHFSKCLCYVTAGGIFILTGLHVPALEKQLAGSDLGYRVMVPGNASSSLT